VVKVRADLPRTPEGQISLPLWVESLCVDHPHLNGRQLEDFITWLADNEPDLVVMSLELAELVAELNMDQASVLAGLIYRGVRQQRFDEQLTVERVGEDAAGIALSVAAMATTSLLEMSSSALQEKEQQDQVENIKHMLVALIDDVRVAVVKLAERVLVMRHAKNYEPARLKRIAEEASGVFAPLAGRLGIWQLKWELEDLALRYTHEDVYQNIAKSLRGKRAEREVQVEHMVDQLRGLLRSEGIDALVVGRAKHIYSIWRKMKSKGVLFDQVYDVRAVRVVVDTLAECYAALGVIHTTWTHIPSEFDDYIANPKENGYQSIHTAVTASDGRTLEIQIRTEAMHEDAELGVCAHWSYKDDRGEDSNYGAKMDWLRQVMEWHEDLGGTQPLSALLQQRISSDRIFVSTPKGHVVELPGSSTVLDFAYRVHTDVGHACRGARVNGMLGRLNMVLETGQQVEVITQPGGGPQRDWLESELGFVHTDRAKAKLFSYFRNLSEFDQIELGRALLQEKFEAMGIGTIDAQDLTEFAPAVGKASADEIWRALGAGELSFIEVILALLEHGPSREQLNLPGISDHEFPESARFRVVGENRDGLLHDITQVIGGMGIALTGTTGRVSNPGAQAIITVDVTLTSLSQKVEFVSYLGLIEGVTEIRKEGL